MNDPTITAEDLTLYALNLLEGDEAARVDFIVRSSSDARRELAEIRGDLALFSLGTEQHTPPALARQRLMKQVARERRTVPISVELPEQSGAAARFARPRFKAEAGAETPAVNDFVRFPSGGEQVMRQQENVEVFRKEPAAAPAEPVPANLLEQPFAADFRAEASSLADPLAFTGRRDRNEAKLSLAETDAEQDRYTPSNVLSFSSYRDNRDEPRENAFSRLFAWSGWAAAAALAAAGAFAVRDNFTLREQVSAQTAAVSQAQTSAARAEMVMQTLQSSSAQRFVLARTDAAPAPSGRVAYLPERGTLVFQGSNLEQLPPYKTYELWLIPAGEGKQPIPAGTFKPDARGYASVVLPEMPKGMIASTFGITREDDGGTTSPTLPILLVGQQS